MAKPRQAGRGRHRWKKAMRRFLTVFDVFRRLLTSCDRKKVLSDVKKGRFLTYYDVIWRRLTSCDRKKVFSDVKYMLFHDVFIRHVTSCDVDVLDVLWRYMTHSDSKKDVTWRQVTLPLLRHMTSSDVMWRQRHVTSCDADVIWHRYIELPWRPVTSQAICRCRL